MAGDLEDFLKRAAERRAQKQQQAGGAAAARPAANQPARPTPQRQPRQRPEYTDARRERQIRQPVEQAIPIAEIVHEDHSADQRQRLADAKRQADQAVAKQVLKQQQQQIHEPQAKERGVISIADGSPIEQLLELIQRPGGMQQAFLLREIMERPEDRWK